MSTANDRPIALLGWSLQAMEAMEGLGRPFVVVAPADFAPAAAEHGLSFVPWDFERLNERSTDLVRDLERLAVKVAIPLYEETVEWAGAVAFHDNPYEEGDAFAVPHQTIGQIEELARASWGRA